MDFYDGRDPRDMPFYTIADAARYLRVPVTTLWYWTRGRTWKSRTGMKTSGPIFEIADPDFLSFTNLVEAHVLAAIRRQYEIPLDDARIAVEYVRNRLGVERPLADYVFETDGVHLFVREVGHLVNASKNGQVAMEKLLRASLKRIERDDLHRAVRVFPFSRDVQPGIIQPRFVVIDPKISFGRPVIAGTGVLTSVVADRHRAGDSYLMLARDYRCKVAAIEEAVRYETEPRAKAA